MSLHNVNELLSKHRRVENNLPGNPYHVRIWWNRWSRNSNCTELKRKFSGEKSRGAYRYA